MKRPVVAALVLLMAAFAGCVGGEDATDPASETSSTSDTQTNATPAANETSSHHDEATLEAPPEWSVGTFWTVEVTIPQSDDTITLTRVVADRIGDTYRVGMPADAFSHPIVVAHFPGLGNVDATNLGFNVHGEFFQPVSFPLTEGQTWSTTLYQSEYEAEVLGVSGTEARIGMSSDSAGDVNLTYDASKKAVTSFSGPLDIQVQVTEHGHDYEGTVKVPHDREQFFDGRVVGVLDLALEPAPPMGSVSISSSFDEASFAHLVGSIPIRDVAPPGVYRETATTPGGNTSSAETFGGLITVYGSSANPSGEWTFEHVAGGFGAAATEIIAYQTQTVELPTETTPS